MELTVQKKCLRRRLGTFLVYVVFLRFPFTSTVVVTSRHVMFANDREITMMGTSDYSQTKFTLLLRTKIE